MAFARNKKQNSEYQTYDEPQGDVVLELDENNVVVCEEGEFNGNEYFNIRKFYKNRDGEWGRAKGLAIPLDMAEALFEGLSEYFENRAPAKKKSVKKDRAEKPTSKNKTTAKTASRSKVEAKPTNKKSAKAEKPTGRKASRLADF